MIVTGDIETILVRDLKPFGIPTYKKDAIPEGEVTEERITVIPKEPKPGTYWIKGFVEVNFCVPDINGMANKSRLTELERQASTHQERDVPLKCHFVNVKIMFEILNVR